MQKRKRDELIAAIEESEPFLEKWLGKEYVHYAKALPEIGSFLSELEKKEVIRVEQKAIREGTVIGKKVIDVKSLTGSTKQVDQRD
jgi:hypothetical protein